MLDFDPDRPTAPPRDAATVLLLREPAGGLEVFLVRRHAKSGFLGGVFVFPGGTIDDADRAPAWASRLDAVAADPSRVGGKADPVAHHVAAIRETFEEAGVLVADGAPEATVRDALRRRLLAGEPFRDLVDEAGFVLRPDRLHPHARWVTPRAERRRYDTVFFSVVVDADELAAADFRETTEGHWLRPGEALEREARGEIQLAPPTARTLRLLADAGSAAVFHARDRTPLPHVEPVFTAVAGVPQLLLPGDPEHPVAAPALPGPCRLTLREGRWLPADID